MKFFAYSQALAALLALSSFHRGYSQEHHDAVVNWMPGGAVQDADSHGAANPEEKESTYATTALRGGNFNHGQGLNKDNFSSPREGGEVHDHHNGPEHAAGAAAAAALPSSSGYGDSGGATTWRPSSFARQLQEATGNADDFIDRYSEDILLVLGLEEPPSNRTELLILMGPFIADIRANLAKENPDFDQSLITDEQIVDLFFPPPLPSFASNSTDTSPPNTTATNSTNQSPYGNSTYGNSTVGLFEYDGIDGDGGRRLQDACNSKLSQVIEMSMNFWLASCGNFFSAAEARTAASKLVAGVDMATARKYAPFRYGNLPTSDEGIEKIVSAAITAAADMKGLSKLTEEAMTAWQGINLGLYVLAGIFAAMMGTGLASAELGTFKISNQAGFGFNEQYLTTETKRQYMQKLIGGFNAACGAISSTPCYDSAWTYNGPSTYARVCTTGWKASCQDDCAQKQCKRSGGTWAGLDPCCNPYTCNYPLDPNQKTYFCPTGWEAVGKGYNGKTGLKCTRGWAQDCDEGCARAQCSSQAGSWANLDPCCNPYTCYLGVKCPKYLDVLAILEPGYYPWNAIGPGPNGQNGLTCTGSYRPVMFEQGLARDTCTGQGGQFPDLDFGSNPFTCYMPEPK